MLGFQRRGDGYLCGNPSPREGCAVLYLSRRPADFAIPDRIGWRVFSRGNRCTWPLA